MSHPAHLPGHPSHAPLRPVYPFTAIVGQHRLKRALILNAIYPAIGGVLIRGGKGTAKSTAARALATLLPEIEVVEGCPFGCDPDRSERLCELCRERLASRSDGLPRRRVPAPFVDLPIGATEDRVIGTLDIGRTLHEGRKHFEPGLLARANRGVLYIDEVNLLPDHLVDAILDAAAAGVNVVEREGISLHHPASFVLIGTMNPEEGELRPQLLDRFGLSVEAEGPGDPALRAEVVRRQVAFERDPEGFLQAWAQQEAEERARITQARSRLPHVPVDDPTLELIARVCLDFGVEGMRADLVIYRAAAALAAYEGRGRVTGADVREAAELALPHRMRRRPFEEPALDRQRLEEQMRQHAPAEFAYQGRSSGREFSGARARPGTGSGRTAGTAGAENRAGAGGKEGSDSASGGEEGAPGGNPPEPGRVFPVGRAFPPTRFALVGSRRERAVPPSGRRLSTTAARARGRAVRAVPGHQGRRGAVALAASLRTAAARTAGSRRAAAGALGSSGFPPVTVTPRDLWFWEYRVESSSLVVFLLDTSGSMGVRRRMAATKGAVLSLLLDAYRRRDRVALIAFRDRGAEVVLPPTRSVELARRRLEDLPTGGRTPLASALEGALHLMDAEARRRSGAVPLLVVVSDGKANVPLIDRRDPVGQAMELAGEVSRRGLPAVVVDTEDPRGEPLGLARELAVAMGALHLPLADLERRPFARLLQALPAGLGLQARR